MPRQRLDGVDHLAVRLRLQQIAARAGVQHLGDQLVAVVHGEHQHFGRRAGAADLARRLDAVEDRQRDIEDRDVRLVLDGEFDRLASIARLGADGEVRIALDQRSQATTNYDVVIGQQDTQRHHSPLVRPAHFPGTNIAQNSNKHQTRLDW